MMRRRIQAIRETKCLLFTTRRLATRPPHHPLKKEHCTTAGRFTRSSLRIQRGLDWLKQRHLHTVSEASCTQYYSTAVQKSAAAELSDRLQAVRGKRLAAYYMTVMLFCQVPTQSPGVMNERLTSLYKKITVGTLHSLPNEHSIGIDEQNRTESKDEPQTDRLHVEGLSLTKTAMDTLFLLGDDSCQNGDHGINEDNCLPLMSKLLPEIQWLRASNFVDNFRRSLPQAYIYSDVLAKQWHLRNGVIELNDVEDCLGYDFRNKFLLVEAMTRASAKGTSFTYERLEFLGDAILAQIMNLKIGLMHKHRNSTLKSVCCNRYILSFLALDLVVSRASGETALEEEATRPRRLVDYIRVEYDQAQLSQREKAEATYKENCLDIHHALEKGEAFPWTLLHSIDAPKVYSDIIESLLGAVYVDSGADLDACERLLDRIGLLKILKRFADTPPMDPTPPKTRLSRKLRPWRQDWTIGHSTKGSTSKGTLTYTSQIIVGAAAFCEASSQISFAHADSLVAEMALDKLRSEPGIERLQALKPQL